MIRNKFHENGFGPLSVVRLMVRNVITFETTTRRETVAMSENGPFGLLGEPTNPQNSLNEKGGNLKRFSTISR